MNKLSGEIEENVSRLVPSILDASVFSSFPHCQTLLEAGEEFFVSAQLYTLFYKKYDKRKVFDTLRHFVWRPQEYLPSEKLHLQPCLIPYEFKKEYIQEIYPYYQKSLLPLEVKRIILDEYSFLREHSSILMFTKRFSRHLYRWGIILLDATNKVYDRKRFLFGKIRGPRWILGVLLSSTGIKTLSEDPVMGAIFAGGGTALILFDP